MTGVLQTLSPQISQGTPSVISLPGLVDGQEHLKLPSGTQIDLFGQDLHPVKVSQSLEKEKEKTIADTSGLSSLISSESAILQQSLVNRLQQLSDMDGSTIYKTTLKQKATPQGRLFFQLAASALRTKENDSSSWPTPTSATGGPSKNPNNKRGINGGNPMATAASLVPWLTPTTSDMNGVRELDGKRSGGLNTQAQAAWPTPSQRDFKGGYQGGRIRNGKISVDTLDVAAQLTPWATPTANPANGEWEQFLERKRKSVAKGNKMGISLTDTQMQAKSIAPWATPTATDPTRGTKPPRPHDTGIPLTQQVSGLNKEKSTAETEKTVPSQLNPRFSLWLMGYPIEWAYSGERVTPSSRKRQRKS